MWKAQVHPSKVPATKMKKCTSTCMAHRFDWWLWDVLSVQLTGTCGVEQLSIQNCISSEPFGIRLVLLPVPFSAGGQCPMNVVDVDACCERMREKWELDVFSCFLTVKKEISRGNFQKCGKRNKIFVFWRFYHVTKNLVGRYLTIPYADK